MIKVKSLKKGSRLAVISPSSGLPAKYPAIYELGLKHLRETLGFEVVEMPTARMNSEELYLHPEKRAEDINKAFQDDAIDGIICSIGGYDSVRLLKYLEVDEILKHPKLIMGFSDATTFLAYLNTLGMVTFYGPSVMAGLAQLMHLSEMKKHMEDVFFHLNVPYIYRPYKKWTHGYRDWTDKKTLGECTEFYNNTEGFRFLNDVPPTEGLLWGGCIEVLEFIKGTEYWPKREFFKEKILFFETSEDKPLPHQVGYMLRNYGISGILNQVNGILFARPKDYTLEEVKELEEEIKAIIDIEFQVKNIPVAFNVDFGHTDPKFIFPLGCKVRIDSVKKEILLLESPYEDKRS